MLRSNHENVQSWQAQQVTDGTTQKTTLVDKCRIRTIAECEALCTLLGVSCSDGEKWRSAWWDHGDDAAWYCDEGEVYRRYDDRGGMTYQARKLWYLFDAVPEPME